MDARLHERGVRNKVSMEKFEKSGREEKIHIVGKRLAKLGPVDLGVDKGGLSDQSARRT